MDLRGLLGHLEGEVAVLGGLGGDAVQAPDLPWRVQRSMSANKCQAKEVFG